jgi:hypothetical protein
MNRINRIDRSLLVALICTFASPGFGQTFQTNNKNLPLIPAQKDLNVKQNAGIWDGQTGLPVSKLQDTASGNLLVQTISGQALAQGSMTLGSQAQVGIENNTTVKIKGNVVPIGTTLFQFTGFNGMNSQGGQKAAVGGMIMRGGFTVGNGYQVGKNIQFGWVQFAQYTNFDGTKEPIDNDGEDSTPIYAENEYKVPRVGALGGIENGNMTAAIFDAPNTGNSPGMQDDFISVLVCYTTGSKVLDLIGDETWGFTLTGNQKNGSGGIQSTYANQFVSFNGTVPDLGFWQTGFTQFYGPQGTANKGWTTSPDCSGCVVSTPGPEAAFVASFAALPLAFIRRRKRQ